MNPQSRPWIVGLVVTLALLGGACGNNTSAAKSSSETKKEATSTTQPGASPSGKESTDPAEQQAKMEDEVATCMKAKGWDYKPNPPMDLATQEPSGGLGATDEKYGKKHGYGIVDAFSGAGSSGGGSGTMVISSSVASASSGDSGSLSGPPKDPNADYVSSLSETERTQYLTDLYGKAAAEAVPSGASLESEGSVSVSSSASDGGLEMGGCQGDAMKAAGFDGPQGQSVDPMAELENDPAVIEATEKWASCMSAKGFDAESPMKVVQDFVENVVSPAMAPSGDGGKDGSGDSEGSTPDQSEVDSLRKQEIELWTADNDCQKSSGYAKAQKAVLDRLSKVGK